MFADADLTADGFLGGRLTVLQPRDGYRAALDTVLLAAAADARPGDRVLDLGCGSGVAGLCLAARIPGILLTGIELQPAYAELARRNAESNGIAATIFAGDLSAPPADLRAMTFDHVIANPPYFPAGSGTPAADTGRETAQREATPLGAWGATAIRRLRPGGRLTLIHAVDRLPQTLAALPGSAGSIVVLPVTARAGRPAGRFILRTRKGGRAAFRLLAPLVLHRGERHAADGDSFSDEAAAILRDAQAIVL